MAAIEKVERSPVEVGIKPQATSLEVPKERQLDVVMERLRSKAQHFKSWAENAKAINRVSLMDRRHVFDSSEKTQLQKCLDTLQRSIKVTSLQSMVERLESISRQLGLTCTAGQSGNNECFISSDMFYVEVVMEPSGIVKDVKIAHHGDPVSCPELSEVLSKWDFAEFTKHLEGLSAIYQLNADKKQKSKAYLALQALETDLTMLSQLQSSINDPCNLVHKSPVGILQTRKGGHPMKLTYFISPYDLLDMEAKTLMPLTVDAVIEKQLGYSVMVCIESSMAHKLQTQSLMSISRTPDGKSLPSFAAPSNLNSTTLPASFVLNLDSPMPIAIALVRKIQTVTHIECGDQSTTQPLLSLITERASKGELDGHSRGLFVTLPDQHHCYFLSGSSDLQGVMVSSIPFTHPTHVPQILIFLRQQALFNVLISSCIRPHSKQDLETALMFEVSALSWLHVTVAFEHPIEESMATAEFDLSDITNVKCRLHTMPNDTPICTDEYASKVIQRCLSIPVTMRALIRKAQGQHHQRINHSNSDMLLNLLPNGTANLLGHQSPFSEAGSGSKFVTDFDVKLNGRGSDGMSDASNIPKVDVSETSLSTTCVSTVTSSSTYSAPADLNQTSLTLDTPVFLDGTPPSSSSTHGDLFSIPPERAGSLASHPLPSTPSPIENMLSQAVPQHDSPSLQVLPSTSVCPTQSQGKPNAMLMNMLHDFTQCVSLTEDTSQALPSRKLSPVSSVSYSLPPPPPPHYQGKPNAMLMNLLHEFPERLPLEVMGGTGTAPNFKPRKPRKRKSTTDASSPRSTTGRSPKRKASEDDSSKDLLTPDAESNDSINMTFETTSTPSVMMSSSSVNFLNPIPSCADVNAIRSLPLDAHPALSKSGNESSTFPVQDQKSVIVTPDPNNTNLVGISGTEKSSPIISMSGMSQNITVSSHGTTSNSGEFQLKPEPHNFDSDVMESKLSGISSNVTEEDDEELSLESCQSDPFSISSSSGASLKVTSGTSDKVDIKKPKKAKLEGASNKSEDKDISLGKEIEKIPIVLDITSSDSKPTEVVRTTELLDKRPSVEIIPLGMSNQPPSTHAQQTSGMTMFNSSIKLPKQSLESSKKDGKMKQRDLRRASADVLDRKSKVEGKKDRKRKRLESVDGLEGGLKPPKIINVITPIPASHAGMTVMDRTMSIVSHKSLDLPLSRQVTLSVKPPHLSSTANSSISVSVTKTVVTPTSSVKKTIIPSPNISPAMSISHNKSVSILKASQSGKPKPTLNKSPSLSSPSTNATKGVGSLESSSGKTTETANAKVTISPLKVQNKNKQSVLVKNGSQTVHGGLATPKAPTKLATAKVKQQSIPPSTTTVTSSATSRVAGSGLVSKNSSAATSTCANTTVTSLMTAASTLVASSSVSSSSIVVVTTSCASSSIMASAATASSSSSSKGHCSPMSQANLALLAAQKVSKLAARSRKGSLSAVIDKLMASSMQHTGSGGDNPPPTSKKAESCTKPDGTVDKKDPKGDKKDVQGTPFHKTTGEAKQPKSAFSDSKASEMKKAEFTVKQSSQGIKLTVTKTHCTEGGTKLSSSIRSTSSKSSGTKLASSSPSSLSKISGSATGLKPGVNSGPASKKVVSSTVGAGTKSVLGQKGSSAILSSMKTCLASSMALSSAAVSGSTTLSTSTASHPSSHLPGSALTSKPSANPSSGTKTISKHSVSEVKPASMNRSLEKANKSSSQDSSSSISNRPGTPKNISIPIIPLVPSSMPPPPPPPPFPLPPLQPPQPGVSLVVDHNLQQHKREESPMRHSPVRPFLRHSRDSPVEESETERAFQRLLQVQGVSSVPKSSNGTLDMASGRADAARTLKPDLLDKSAKHSNPDGRSTPKSMLTEKCNITPPNLGGSVVAAKVAPVDYKRPLTPKSDSLAKMDNSYVSQAPMEPLIAVSSSAMTSSLSAPSSTSSSSFPLSSCSSSAITDVLLTLTTPMTAPNLPPSKVIAHKLPMSTKLSSSPGRKETCSPEDSLVIDCPNMSSHKSPERKLHKVPLMMACPDTLTSQTKSPAEIRMPVSPVQQLKSPAQPSPGMRSPAVASTPQSEHSNPSSVAHSSPYDIDDELMDEALVGLGK